MKEIPFTKMSGCGNDFILIDNRQDLMEGGDRPVFVAAVCRRKLSVGADGVIFIESSDTADFRWDFFNADGSTAEMCGNGARCAARFAFMNGIAGGRLFFETLSGTVSAEITGETVKLRMTDPGPLKTDIALDLPGGRFSMDHINTGVPHAVVPVEDCNTLDVVTTGRAIRFHSAFGDAGTNANFVSPSPDGKLVVRTYERGVEDETLACGTGAVAAALAMSRRIATASPVTVVTRSGGELTIHFTDSGDGFDRVYLEGDARMVYAGRLNSEAFAR